jgi:hypothetical protein
MFRKRIGVFSHGNQYFELLDWTGRQLRATSKGPIAAQIAPILLRK